MKAPRSAKPYAAMLRGRLGGQAGSVQRTCEETGGTIAGEHPSRSVAPVRGGRQAHNQNACIRFADARHGFSPIAVCGKLRLALARDTGAVGPQVGATPAGDNTAPKSGQLIRRGMRRRPPSGAAVRGALGKPAYCGLDRFVCPDAVRGARGRPKGARPASRLARVCRRRHQSGRLAKGERSPIH